MPAGGPEALDFAVGDRKSGRAVDRTGEAALRAVFRRASVHKDGFQTTYRHYRAKFPDDGNHGYWHERIATIHKRLALLFAHSLPLKILRLPVTMPPFGEALQWPASFEFDPALMWLRDLICKIAAEINDPRTSTVTFD